MIFLDAGGTQVGSTVVSTSSVAFGSTENTWIQLTTLPSTAPAGATQMIFQLNLTRGATGGVMFADDADLEDVAVPEPALIGFVGIRRSWLGSDVPATAVVSGRLKIERPEDSLRFRLTVLVDTKGWVALEGDIHLFLRGNAC